MSRMTLSHGGAVRHALPGQALTFGRAGDLQLSSDTGMHRLVGRIRAAGDVWYLDNLSLRLRISVIDQDNAAVSIVGPGRTAPLTVENGRIEFISGAAPYTIDFRCEQAPQVPPRPNVVGDTTSPGRIPLQGDQLLLAIALCERKLLHSASLQIIPANKDIARRFGWSVKQLDRKLDKICAKFAAGGVEGLVGVDGAPARDRRQVLVQYLVDTGRIVAFDLRKLP